MDVLQRVESLLKSGYMTTLELLAEEEKRFWEALRLSLSVSAEALCNTRLYCRFMRAKR